ncbi:hypothetical protein D9M69_624300 [compost metagenome]
MNASIETAATFANDVFLRLVLLLLVALSLNSECVVMYLYVNVFLMKIRQMSFDNELIIFRIDIRRWDVDVL